jgi:predicted ATPase
MQDLEFQPEMIGREDELDQLQTYLDKTSQGYGNTIFISGEAGIGKTRLVNELKKIAQDRGFQILSGNSMYESLTPLMPIQEALRSGGLESLFAEEAPRVEAIYLVTHSGLLIKEIVRKETKLDPDIFSALFTTVNEFISKSLSTLLGKEKAGSLNSMGFENYRILIDSGENANLVVVITGKENEFLINEMKEKIHQIQDNYQGTLSDWDGDDEKIVGIGKLIDPLITSGKYDGINYGKQDPKTRRNLLFENVSMGLTRQAHLSPTLLSIEDLQWADPSTLALIHYISRNTKISNLVILGTYRPEDVTASDGKGHPLIGTMQLMDREDLLENMKLQRLPEESIDEFLTSLLQMIDFTNEFKKKIYTETEGNPLFIIELIKFLVDENVIQNLKGTWKLGKPLEDGTIPSKVLSVISRRLDRVEKEDRKILDYASVIGEIFNTKILASTLDIRRVQLLEHLRSLGQTHKLIHPHNGNYKFDHIKIKEVLYSELPTELGMEYHFRIAETIQELNQNNIEDIAVDLAFHYYHSQDQKKALPLLVRIAEKATKSYSNKEAIRFYQQALELESEPENRQSIYARLASIYELTAEVDQAIESYNNALKLSTSDKERPEFLSKIGSLYARKGETEEAMSYCNKALDLVDGSGTIEEAHAFKLLGNLNSNNFMIDEALSYYEKSRKIYHKLDHMNGVASTLNDIGVMLRNRGEYEIALNNLKESLNIYENRGNFRGSSDTLISIGELHFHKGELSEALKNLERSIRIAEIIGDMGQIARCHFIIGQIRHDLGNYDDALDYYETALKIREKAGEQIEIAKIHHEIGFTQHSKGNYEEALRNCEQARQIVEEVLGDRTTAATHCLIGQTFRDMGQYKQAQNHLEKSIQLEEEIGDDRPGMVCHLSALGLLQLYIGEIDIALNNMKRSLQLGEKYGNNMGMSVANLGIAEVYLRTRDLEKASDFNRRGLSLATEVAMKDLIARAKRIFGQIQREQRNWTDSRINFKSCIQSYENMGRVADLGESHYEFGLMWKAKGEPEKAKEHLNKSYDIFKDLKLNKKTEKVKTELNKLS